MLNTDSRNGMQALWNAKFQGDSFVYGEEPNAFIKENEMLLLPCERVLCLGEGEGRNALYLAEKGMEVEAMDASDVGLFKLRANAKARYVEVKLRHTLLAYWDPTPSYGAVVCTYLHVPKNEQKMLFEKALFALEFGGIFIAELFSESQKMFHSGGPKELDLLYDINTITHTLKSLPCAILKLSQEIIVLNEGAKHQGRASVIRVILKKKALV